MSSQTKKLSGSATAKMAYASIGVVFGDIGTSPLYTMREALRPVISAGGDTRLAVLGVVSLLIWGLLLIVTLKYVFIIMRADNHGEGGILSQVALVQGFLKDKANFVLLLGIIGAAFFFGDAMITPAISVLSAVEGLKIINPGFASFVLPITLTVLMALFFFQYRGTSDVAKIFAPATALWFFVIGIMGLVQIIKDPAIFQAVNPYYGVAMLLQRPGLALLVFGGVFLAVTGGEALYADMGHFGKKPIRLAWLCVALPGLLLNYLGQGAFVLMTPAAMENPFFLMAPSWALIPLVILATLVTIIASQAVITGAYSIAQQAMSLNLIPRMEITHTSESEQGQIYIANINWLLLTGVLMLVLVFKSSDALASAYGIAVNVAMLVNNALAIIYFYYSKTLPRYLVLPALSFIFLIETVFLAANGLKLASGGYLPLIIGTFIMIIMLTWMRGRNLLIAKYNRESVQLNDVLQSLERHPPSRVAGAAIFMQTDRKFAPSALMHNLKHNRVLHDRLIFISIETTNQPRADDDRVQVTQGPLGAWMVHAKFGYMEQPDVPAVLRACAPFGLEVDPRQASYFLGRRVIKSSPKSAMPFWQQRIFIMLADQSSRAVEFFRIPPDRVVELGMQMSV